MSDTRGMPHKASSLNRVPRTRSARRMLAAIERSFPGLTRREWGALAVAAARRAGLEKPDLDSLRVNLRNQFAIDDRRGA